MSGAASLRIHLLMGALLISRMLHPLGMYARPPTLQFQLGRIGGMTLTIAVMITSASQILLRLWRTTLPPSTLRRGQHTIDHLRRKPEIILRRGQPLDGGAIDPFGHALVRRQFVRE